jgi:hypothetical protein
MHSLSKNLSQDTIQRLHRLSAFAAFALSLFVYILTLAPTVQLWDNGELIAAAVTLGPSHPPGAPLYMLIGRLISRIPISGDIACRLNFLSALCSSLAVMFTYLIIVRLIRRLGQPLYGETILASLIGALIFAFTDAFWFNATEAELYSLSVLMTACLVWLILKWDASPDPEGDFRFLWAAAWLTGLAIGVHLMTILTLLAAGFLVYVRWVKIRNQRFSFRALCSYGLVATAGFFLIYPGISKQILHLVRLFGLKALFILIVGYSVSLFLAVRWNRKALVRILFFYGLILLGSSTYLLIPIRSKLNPPMDTGDPEQIDRLISYVERDQFGSWGLLPRRYPGLMEKSDFKKNHPGKSYPFFNMKKQLGFYWNVQVTELYLRYVGWQFLGRSQRLDSEGRSTGNFSIRGLWGIPFLLAFIGAVYHFRRDPYAAFTLLALFIVGGLLIVTYLNQVSPQPRERDGFYTGSYWALALWIGLGVFACLDFVRHLKYSGNRTLLVRVVTLLMIAAGPGLLLSKGWKSHQRRHNTFARDYAWNMLAGCKPNAILFVQGDNDTYPVEYLQMVEGVRSDVTLINLIQLNHNFVIRQLRDSGIRFSFTDSQIDALKPAFWQTRMMQIPLPDSLYGEEFDENSNSETRTGGTQKFLQFTLHPTIGNYALRVQDMAALDLITENQWRRPVYFAMTVSDENRLGLQSYFELTGLNYRLLPFLSEKVDTASVEKFMDTILRIRHPEVVLRDNDPLARNMIGNYRVPSILLAWKYSEAGKPDRAIRALRRMEKRLPFRTFPPFSPNILIQTAELYAASGLWSDTRRVISLARDQFPDSPAVLFYQKRWNNQ